MDNHSRGGIHDGSLMRYMEEFSITGLSLNSETFCESAAHTAVYDDAIKRGLVEGIFGEPLACSLVMDDIRYGADLLRPVYDRTDGVDGWAMLPASPLATDNPETFIRVVLKIQENIRRPNVLVRLPVIPNRIQNVEELVYRGMPINISNIYSPVQYTEVATACLSGIKRRIADQQKPVVPIFISIGVVHLAIALSDYMDTSAATETAYTVARKIYSLMRADHNSPQWEAAYNSGARPLRLVWNCSLESMTSKTQLELANRLKAPLTVITLPKQSIRPFMKSRDEQVMPYDCDECDKQFEQLHQEGTDIEKIAAKLQEESVATLRNSWIMVLETVARKSAFVSQQENTTIRG